MEDKIILDKKVFKALASDTRTSILKILGNKKQTLSDLAASLGLSKPTVKEHLSVLVKVGLIEKIDEGRKWKYYKLTDKGKGFVEPKEVKVWVTFAVSILGFLAALGYILKGYLFKATDKTFITSSESVTLESSSSIILDESAKAAPAIYEQTTPIFPYLIGLVFLGIIIFCIYKIIKKRKNNLGGLK